MKIALTENDIVELLGTALSKLRQHSEAFALQSDGEVRQFVADQISQALTKTWEADQAQLEKIGAIRDTIDQAQRAAETMAADFSQAIEASRQDTGLMVKTSADQLQETIAAIIKQHTLDVADELAERDEAIVKINSSIVGQHSVIAGNADALPGLLDALKADIESRMDTKDGDVVIMVAAAVEDIKRALAERDTEITSLRSDITLALETVNTQPQEFSDLLAAFRDETATRMGAKEDELVALIAKAVEDHYKALATAEEARETRLLEMRLEITNALRGLEAQKAAILDHCRAAIDKMDGNAEKHETALADLEAAIVVAIDKTETVMADAMAKIDAALAGFESQASESKANVSHRIDALMTGIEDRLVKRYEEDGLRRDALVNDSIAEIGEYIDAKLTTLLPVAISKALDADPERFRGLPGEQGQPGERGIPGQDGLPGQDGERGIDGKDGRDGAQGERGLQGERGENGLDGQSFEYCGLWKSEHEYRPGDVISEGGSTWICLHKNHDDRPSKMVESGPRSWQIVAMRGAKGERGLRGEAGPAGPEGKPHPPVIDVRIVGKTLMTVYEDGTLIESELPDDFFKLRGQE